MAYSQFHRELGSNGDGDPNCITSDGDNDFFVFNNRRQMFLTKVGVLAKSDNNRVGSNNSKSIMEPFDSEKFQAHHTWQQLLGFRRNDRQTLFCPR